MSDSIADRLTQLEDERKQVLAQIDAVLRDIAKLDLGAAP